MTERRLLKRLGLAVSAASLVASGCQAVFPKPDYGLELVSGRGIADCFSEQPPVVDPIVVRGENRVQVIFSGPTQCIAKQGLSQADILSMGITSSGIMDHLDTIVDAALPLPISTR